MARILYGVAGEGFGHSSRTHITGKMLKEAGHSVLFAASNKSLEYLGRYFPEDMCRIHGLTFHYENATVNLPKTFFFNFAQLPELLRVNYEAYEYAFRKFAPDVVITDFDPFTSYWAYKNNVPCISIDHEHLVSKYSFERPEVGLFERLMSEAVTHVYHKSIDAYIVLNFFNASALAPNAFLAPPVMRDEVLEHSIRDGEHIIFYATTESCLDEFLPLFKQFPQQQFVLYGFGKEGPEANCVFKHSDTNAFLEDLASCKGVIASGGFSLISECLYYGKRMLVKPIQNQVEQMINAYHLQRIGAGFYAESIDKTTIMDFLDWLETPADFSHEDMLLPDNAAYFNMLSKIMKDVTGGKVKLPRFVEEVYVR
ncbi:MAG: glycosyltransferase family protein [Phycisphaerae bacterium]|jgi:uncharacterized protein (TIGR00661 family)